MVDDPLVRRNEAPSSLKFIIMSFLYVMDLNVTYSSIEEYRCVIHVSRIYFETELMKL